MSELTQFFKMVNIKLNFINKKLMFKKRLSNKDHKTNSVDSQVDSQKQNQNDTTFIKKSGILGFDLRKDIQQMQQNLSQNHSNQKSLSLKQPEITQNYQQIKQTSLFKAKKTNKFTSHILKNLPIKNQQNKIQSFSVTAQKRPHELNQQTDLVSLSGLTENQNKVSQLIQPILSNYGLLDKNHFKSTTNSNTEIIESAKGKNHHQALMDYYIKKRMQEIAKPTDSAKNGLFSGSQLPQKQNDAWQQVLQIQKQYLTQQQKIKEYSMSEIQKKLQKLAQETIKTEVEKRAIYLKDLLENEFERMEYASKKELKIMKQQKERIQKELNSKYTDSGRRNFIQNLKSQTL